MHRQDEGRNGRMSVRLVRVSPHDSRTRRDFERQKNAGQRRKVTALLLVAASFVLICVWSVYFVFYSAADRNEGDTQILISQKKAGRPARREPADDIVVVGDEMHTPRIAIDPGHGGIDGGCEQSGTVEKEINLELALLLSQRLQEMGYETVLIREDNDTKMTLEERVRKAEEARADLYISIHQNTFDGAQASSVSGMETWYCEASEGSRRLAQLVHKGAVEMTGARDRGLKETEELYVIREASMPSCLIETGFLSCAEEREALTSPEYQDKLTRGIAQGVDLYLNPRTMYLTFDDGPSAENTAAVLDILKAHDIKATFFLVGENVAMHPEMARRIVEEGHTVGIHCYRHDYRELYESVDAYLEDFQKAYDIILETTGVEVKLFRFPGGSINSYNQETYRDIIEAMTEKGYIYFDWNASLEDAVQNPEPRQLVQNGVTSTHGRSRVVMLCHDVVYSTTRCLEDLIDSLPEYRMEPLTPEVKPIRFRLPE